MSNRERVLEDAVRLMGREELVDGLKVSEEQLDQWLARRAPMPARKLGDLSELLIKYAYKVRKR